MRLERISLSNNSERVTFQLEGNSLALRIIRAGHIESHIALIADIKALEALADRAYLALHGNAKTDRDMLKVYDLQDLVLKFTTF